MADIVLSLKSCQDLLARLKNQIRTAQVCAAVAVNQELILPPRQGDSKLPGDGA